MKKIYSLILLILLVNTTFSQVFIEWQKCYGGSDTDTGSSIELTSDGGYIFAGGTLSNDGDISNLNGFSDAWIVKLDSIGNIEWEKTYGGSLFDWATSIISTNDGGYIFIGSTNSNDGNVSGNNGDWDIWVVKIDSFGNIQWQKCYGGSNFESSANIIEIPNGYAFTGYTTSNDGNLSGNTLLYNDIWFVRIDFSGNIVHQNNVYGPKGERGHSIMQTLDGNFIIGGDVSHFNNTCQGDIDIIAIKIDSSGNILQQFCGGSPASDVSFFSLPTSDGGYLVTGDVSSGGGDVTNHHGNYDIWLLKIDSNNIIEWTKTIGGTWTDRVSHICENSDGSYSLFGSSSSSDGDMEYNYGATDALVMKIDSLGNIIYSKKFGGTGSDVISGKKINNTTLIGVGWTSSNNIDVSGNHGGNYDVWVVKWFEHYNSIRGKVYIDLNSNLIQDINENYISNHQIFEINSGRFGYSNSNGVYNVLVLDSGNFITSTPPIPYYWPSPITYPIYFSGINQTDSLNDFAFQPLGVFNDLQITITPISPFRPGFDAYYNLHYKNIGTTSLAGTVAFYPDTNVSFVSSDVTPSQSIPDSVLWNLLLLNPFDEGNILVTVNVNQNAVLGSMVNSGAKIEPLAGDANPSNNIAHWEVVVTGSFDPNDILVNKETLTTIELANSPYLEYLIRFQNTGTDTAFTVKVMNNITEMLDVSTFEFVNSSHPLEISYGNHSRLFEFRFDNILLPDSNTNEPLSHGFVRYRIKPFDTLSVGDIIENTATIYFDFNAPIITNTATTEIVLPIPVPHIKNNHNLSLFPNPTTGELNITFQLDKSSDVKIELYNSLGQLVKTITDKKLIAGENKINFSTESYPAGIYHLIFSVDGELIAKKVVKM